jgi:hypothetical protein
MDVHARSQFKARGIDPSPTLTRRYLMDGVRGTAASMSGRPFSTWSSFGPGRRLHVGLLQPVYSLGIDLEAQDVLALHHAEGSQDRAVAADRELSRVGAPEPAGARHLSDVDGRCGSRRKKLAKLYQRKGFQRCGEIWKRGAARCRAF